ncbi:MAG: hypothetical protein PHX44_08470 [Sulfurimonas sp.]|uniref:hypothetical protein n=1 Tax=Sulfurimonas sp. TaxID=2022749 RepID=UPI002626D458|nr:hypothetical protein [Sulfurimonas sp.]MDD2653067.1 hypothetical protein [Sulfurimonas sp.]MDD3452510.1 hypothetical protein [Sulfurimonas sp.]
MHGTIITIVITIWILMLFVMSIKKNSIRNFKGEIVSLGVLGTFIGIAIGLFGFDATDIKSSMPSLLEGLKTAFITSGIGIFFSIVLSISKPLQSSKSQTLQALETVVREFNSNLTSQFGDNFKELNESVKNMILWQDNYKMHISKSEENLKSILGQLEKVEVIKEQEQKYIQELISNLAKSSSEVKESLEASTSIVKEQMQLLLREANRRL